jgi:thiosulfate/3-mercaptopyruvate sulfurtransferase
MKRAIFILTMLIMTAAFKSNPAKRMWHAEPWTPEQLLAPADLAATIKNPKAGKPVIICVGPGALIKGSLDMGPAHLQENLDKLKLELNRLPKGTDIVVYCGCCPFEHCPNIRPAFKLLNEMKFSHAKLLDLEHNIKTDWVARGYPVND